MVRFSFYFVTVNVIAGYKLVSEMVKNRVRSSRQAAGRSFAADSRLVVTPNGLHAQTRLAGANSAAIQARKRKVSDNVFDFRPGWLQTK